VTDVVDGNLVAAHIYEDTTQSTSHDACFLSTLSPFAVFVTRRTRSKVGRKELSGCGSSSA